jgi:hypothetical protein
VDTERKFQMMTIEELNRTYETFTKRFQDTLLERNDPEFVLSIRPKINGSLYYTSLYVYHLGDYWLMEYDDGVGDGHHTYYFDDASKIVKLINVCVDYWTQMMDTGQSVPLDVRGITAEDLIKFSTKPRCFEFEWVD